MSAASTKGRSLGIPEIFAILAAISLLAARFLPVLDTPYRCPFKMIFGIPCMTCGMSHAFVYLAHGQVHDALVANPAGALLAAGVWLFAAGDLARLLAGAPLPRLSTRRLRHLVAGGFAALAVNWTYLLLRSFS